MSSILQKAYLQNMKKLGKMKNYLSQQENTVKEEDEENDGFDSIFERKLNENDEGFAYQPVKPNSDFTLKNKEWEDFRDELQA